MAILVGIGSSDIQPSGLAIDEAYTQASKNLSGNLPTLLILFASSTAYDQEELLLYLKSRSPNSIIIGCSTSGEITNAGSKDRSVALMAIYSDSLIFTPGLGRNIKEDAKKAGSEFAKNILEKSGEVPKAVLMLPDGLAGNGADIVRGVLEVFGQDFRLAGGSAGDDYLFKETYEYYDKEVLTGSVVGVGLYGRFSFGIGVRHGWIPIGIPRIATKSEGNILYELDGKPAIEIYKDQFGRNDIIKNDEPFARLAITYPLGVIAPNKDGYLIRDPLKVEDDGSITCAAEITQGSEVHIMIGSKEEAIEAAKDAAQMALMQVKGKRIKAAFLFNCIARKKLLMQKKQEEIDRIREIIGMDVPIIGFYTYGEQAPLGGEVITCSFHNETDVLFLLAEE